MSVTMRGAEQPFLDTPPADPLGRHRTAKQRTASYYDLLAVPEFRALWSAQLLSYLGDQIAQVAIAVLVYRQTGSPALTALAYALTYLPAVAGTPLLSWAADTFPSRHVMVSADLVRAGLLELMALPRLPLPWTCTCLFVAVLLGPPFSAARSRLLPQILPRDMLALGSAAGDRTFQSSQVAGFLAGGALVAFLGPHRSLALDAFSFCVSAGIIARYVRPRPVSHQAPQGQPWPPPPEARKAPSRLFRDPALRTLVLFGWLAAFAVVPEGLAAPYARALGGGPVTAGLLMAAIPAGMVAGVLLTGRLARPHEQVRMIGWLAMLSCAPLAATLARPPLWGLLPLWFLAGAGGAYQVAVAKTFVRALPAARRRRAFWVAQSGMLAAQGLAIIAAGAAAQRLGPPAVVAIAGMAGLAVAVALTASWGHHRPRLPDGGAPGGGAPGGGIPASGIPASGIPASGAVESGPPAH